MSKVAMVCGGLLLACSLQAGTVLFDNTTGARGGEDPIFGFGPIYASFSTGLDSGTLSKLNLVLDVGPDSSGSISVNLFSNSTTCSLGPVTSDCAGGLITNLGTIPDASLVMGGSVLDVALASNPLLDSNTRYWIGLSASGATELGYWVYASDASGIGVGSELFQNGSGTYDNTDGPYQMAVEVTSAAPTVPEPSTLLLGASTLLSLALIRRRR